jgi:hypothetical protein
MKAEILKFKKCLHDTEHEDLDKTMGICIPTIGKIEGGIPGVFRSNCFATMFLNLKDMNFNIVIHETGHISFMRDFNFHNFIGNYDGSEDMGNQESYCYYLGESAERILAVISVYYPRFFDKAIKSFSVRAKTIISGYVTEVAETKE